MASSNTRGTKRPPPKTPVSRGEREKKGPFRCSCCGTEFPRQQGNFPFNQSRMYDGNDHYCTVCMNCVNELFTRYCYDLNSQEEALLRICMKFDLYYHSDVIAMVNKTKSEVPFMSAYCQKLGLRQFQGKTYDTYMEETTLKRIESEESLAAAKADGVKISAAAIKRWGMGFSPEEYQMADEQYQLLKTANPKADGVQETYMRDLVKTKILQQRAFLNGNSDEYVKYMKAYQDTFKSSRLKMGSDDDADMSDENVCWGRFIQEVEQYTPADLYTNKKLFEDIDGIKEYFKRFIVRPFKNFFTGENALDEEYSVLPGEEEE